MEVDGYEDLVEVGRGGFGVVYRAWQPSLGRAVALKVVAGAGLTDDDRRRFEHEALAMGKLSWHPNIAGIHGTGETNDRHPYLAMEYFEGGSLGDRIRQHGALKPAVILDYGVCLAGALQTAHDAGLLHRDIKPDNVLVDAFGTAKLADFGIAAVAGHTRTASGVITGSVAHAAPEILNGEQASERSDVYSLGSTLFELAAGHAAFVRPDDESIVAIALRVASHPVPDLRPLGTPDAVADVIEASMTKNPADRFQSMEAFGRALQHAQRATGQPITALPLRPDGTEAAKDDEPATWSTAPITVTLPAEANNSGGGTLDATDDLASANAASVPATAKPRRARTAVIAAFVALVVLVAGSLAFAARGGGNSGDPASEPAGTDASSPTPSEPSTTTTSPATSTTNPNPETSERAAMVDIETGPSPEGVAATDQAVWVATDTGLTRVAPETDSVETTIQLEASVLTNYSGVAATGAAAWVVDATDQTVTRVDAASGAVSDTIALDLGGGSFPRHIAATEDAVWVLGTELTRIDPSNNLARNIEVDCGGGGCGGVAATADAVWLAAGGEDQLIRVDPTTNAIDDTISVGSSPTGVAATPTAVWVVNQLDENIQRIDPDTNDVTETIPIPDSDLRGIAATNDDVWAIDSGGTLYRIDPDTNEVTATLETGHRSSPDGYIAATDDAVWVTSTDDDLVTRVDASAV